jgi:protein O-GlcNAc transferase
MSRAMMTLVTTVAVVGLLVPAASADYKQAVAYYNQGQFEKSIQELKPDLEKNPDWEFGHRLLGLCYLGLKNNALAVSSLSRAVQLKSTAYAAYYGLAQAYFNMQRYEDCIKALSDGERYLPDTNGGKDKYNLYHLRGSANFRLQRYDAADDDLTAAIRISQTDWVDYSQLGVCYFNMNRLDEAIQALQRADSIKPGQSVNAEFLGKAYFKRGAAELSAKQYAPAAEALLKAKEYDPKNGFICYNLGEAYLFQKNFAAAEKAYTQASDALGRNADVYTRLGLVYENLKKWDLAINAYQKANEISPSSKMKEAINRVNEAKKPQ